ncbi:hypothetical protein OBV_25880 [Oscillibacter valericigenes Sjm18-20]|nr:hypothetical protein OBV_25880 [Oscillibacter valericigenes Sjm18-20]
MAALAEAMVLPVKMMASLRPTRPPAFLAAPQAIQPDWPKGASRPASRCHSGKDLTEVQ